MREKRYFFEFVDSCSVISIRDSLTTAFATALALVLFGVAHACKYFIESRF